MKTKYMAPFAVLIASVLHANGQETKKYSNNGIAFEYMSSWDLTEKPGTDTSEIALWNADADTQITVIAVKKSFDSDKPEDIKKRLADPWLDSLRKAYATRKIVLGHEPTKTEAGGVLADGVKMGFFLDDQIGAIEAYWLVLNKKPLLVYMIRPERTAAKAATGWDLLRKTLATAGTK